MCHWSAGTVSIGLLLKAQGSGGAPRDTFDAHGIHGCHGAMQRFNNSYGSDPKTAAQMPKNSVSAAHILRST